MVKTIITTTVLFLITISCFSDTKSVNETKIVPLKYIIVNGVEGTDLAFKKIVDVFTPTTDRDLQIGVGFIISYLSENPVKIKQRLETYLSLSAKYNLPVLVQLDGEQWWQNRPDLWNWWDKNKPGYNPENKRNVEWTAWTPDSAVKIGWRNWGRQLRVLPMPNLMSHSYREACSIEMGKLMPIIIGWWKALPKEKKYLLAGVKIGWESAIGVNNWYYPNGNSYLDKPEKDDPTYGLSTDKIPDRGVISIGYAAVKTAKIASSGELTGEMQTEVVRMHLEYFCKLASKLGVPRERLFTHCGGWSQGETLHSAAVNKYSCPGWSFYKYGTDPSKDITAMKALELSNAPYWGAVEWLYQGENTKELWKSAITNTISSDRIRYMCIYNWGGIKNNLNAISAINEILEK